MLDRLSNFFITENIDLENNPILLAVSGGVDSMLMLDLFRVSGIDFEIAHCNFGLRGEESEADEKLVARVAGQIGVKCHIEYFETAEYAKKKGVSIEMAARELRYNWFNKLLEKGKCRLLATAHHKTDVVETMLLNLVKGTGIAGLHGIKPKRANIIRPMLFATRSEILQEAKERNLIWRDDKSNESRKHQRNQIRLDVLPKLKTLNPAVEEAFNKTAYKVSEAEKFIKHYIDRVFGDVSFAPKQGSSINIKLVLNSPSPIIILYELLKTFGFNYQQCTDILEALNGGVGKIFLTDQFQANIDREDIIINRIPMKLKQYKIEKDDQCVEYGDKKLEFIVVDTKTIKLKNKDSIALLDAEQLKFPLLLRPWEAGDYFYPLGLKGKKKLSDFMIDKKIPVNLKQKVMVLVSGDSIAWVVGYRIDERYKIRPESKFAYKFELKENV